MIIKQNTMKESEKKSNIWKIVLNIKQTEKKCNKLVPCIYLPKDIFVSSFAFISLLYNFYC